MTLRTLARIVLCFCFIPAKAQVVSYSQYNGALASINPAYMTAADKNNFSYIIRNQWPGFKLQSTMQDVSINGYSAKMHSGFGLTASQRDFVQGSSRSYSFGLQYSYKVMFLEDYILNFGFGISDVMTRTAITGFEYKYDPKKNYATTGDMISQAQNHSLQFSYGFIFQEARNKFNGGLSIRNQEVYFIDDITSEFSLKTKPVLSLQGMKSIPITRMDQLYLTAFYDVHGKTTYMYKGTESVLIPTFHAFMLQANLYNRRRGIIGIGYKYFFGNYGSTNLRYAFLLGKNRAVTLGYSFDTKVYIQYDKLQFMPSHEAYVKINIANLKNNFKSSPN